jgi:hypothetical protein
MRNPFFGFGGSAALFSTLNPLDKDANIVLSNNNLTATNSTANFGGSRGTRSRQSGKYYLEFSNLITGTPQSFNLGFATQNANISAGPGGDAYGVGYYGGGQIYVMGAVTGGMPTYGPNDVINGAIDLTNNKVWFRKNGVWVDGGDPSANTGGFTISGGVYFPDLAVRNSASATINVGSTTFSYAVPSGFSAFG